jgi:opacity protein-like surface antigen
MLLFLSATLALLAPGTPSASSPAPETRFDSAELAALYVPSEDTRKSADFSYTFLQLGYSVTNLDTIDDDAKGLNGRASLGLFDVLYVFLDYSNKTTNFQNTNADLYGLGAGAHVSVMPKLDLVGEAAWLSSDIGSDLSTLNESNDGWTAMAGARWMPVPWEGGGLELDGGFRWIDLKGLLSDTQTGAWEVGARFHFLKMFSIGAEYSFLEQDRQWGLDARVSF